MVLSSLISLENVRFFKLIEILSFVASEQVEHPLENALAFDAALTSMHKIGSLMEVGDAVPPLI